MPYETIEVKPATAAIGAEISGVDLARPLGNQQFQEVHDALMAHQVVFFRDQKLTSISTRRSAGCSANCTSIPTRPAPTDIRRSCRSTRTRTPNASPASAGTRMCRATRSRRWVRS